MICSSASVENSQLEFHVKKLTVLLYNGINSPDFFFLNNDVMKHHE